MHKKIVGNIIINLLYQLLAIVTPFMLTPYLTRILGSQGMGIYAYYYSIASYFGLFSMLGVTLYGNRTIAKTENKKERTRVFYEIYSIQAFASCLVLAAYLIYTIAICKNLKISWIFAIQVLAYAFDINWFFFGIEEFKITVTRNSMIKIFSIIMVFCTVKNECDVEVYACITASLTLITNVFLFFNLKNRICKVSIDKLNIYRHLKSIFVFFIPVITVSIYNIMDKIMLGILSDMEEVGFYECSEKIKNLPMSFVTALGTVMLPRISNMFDKGESEKGHAYLEQSLNISMCIISPICFGIMAIVQEFVPLFYGKGFERCIDIYPFLLLSCLFLCFAQNIKTQYLIPENKEKIFIISTIVGAVSNLVLNLVFIPRYDSVGAAIGTLCAEISVWAFQCIKIYKDIPIKKYIINVIPYISASMIMYIFTKYVRSIFSNNLVNIIAKVIFGTILYFLILFIFDWRNIFLKRNR